MAIIKWKNRAPYDSWKDMKSLQESINDLFDIDLYPGATGLFDRNVSPAANVVENENEFVVSCELPGIDQKDIDVSITSNVLTIKGEKKDSHEEKKSKYYKKETWSGSFQRTISLPFGVEKEQISAELKDGILVITLPKKEESRPKQISVNIK